MGFGDYPKEYNPAVHGPYDPARYYGKRKIKINNFILESTMSDYVIMDLVFSWHSIQSGEAEWSRFLVGSQEQDPFGSAWCLQPR